MEFYIYDYLLTISGEIGTDISFIRTDQGNKSHYLTGFDFSLFLSAGLLSCFFIPLIGGFANRIGESLADATIKRLNMISESITEMIGTGKTDEELYRELSKSISDQILAILKESKAEEIAATDIMNKQIRMVSKYLIRNHFPEDKANQLSDRIIHSIYHTNLL